MCRSRKEKRKLFFFVNSCAAVGLESLKGAIETRLSTKVVPQRKAAYRCHQVPKAEGEKAAQVACAGLGAANFEPALSKSMATYKRNISGFEGGRNARF